MNHALQYNKALDAEVWHITKKQIAREVWENCWDTVWLMPVDLMAGVIEAQIKENLQ